MNFKCRGCSQTRAEAKVAQGAVRGLLCCHCGGVPVMNEWAFMIKGERTGDMLVIKFTYTLNGIDIELKHTLKKT